LEIGKAKITSIDDSTAFWRNESGRESSRPIEQIVRIAVDDEPTLTAGEEAFAAGKFDVATDNYLKAIKSTKKDWVKDWTAKRLITAADKAGRFDAAVVAYIAAVLRNPAKAPAKPAMPDAKSTYLATAVADVQQALSGQRLNAEQRQALQSFLLDLHRARGDQKALGETMQQMVKTGAAASSDPTAAGALARLKLDVARVALDGKQYKKALDEIQANRNAFVQPADQAKALFYLAQAQEGLAGEDAAQLQDAALAYMRVVAHCKDAPGKPHVVESLMKTADILERTKNGPAAMDLYQQIATQHPDDPAAAKASENYNRLKEAAAPKQG